ncbi:hypothetical protein IQ235_07870 [Oscillatoriales cyanobacterium LEGE 11467]|uniref:Uncharacterized protein n=1 Tax=Zarconia navalis LEGE 11467 TaxID=1828826 RepID=A0A928VZU5_9CYAN|nr:hypothetical protein [Zarconia navalis]MBE9040695.1 hypothetical protein [Zarconia navalis LEGE 11467]
MTTDSATVTRYYREQALDTLDIGKTTFYKWVEYLGIEQKSDSSRKKYLNSEQMNQLEELKVYHNKNGKIEGFLNNKTDESGALVQANDNAIATEDTTADLATEDIYVEPEEPTANMDIDGLMRQAAELKARNLAMPELVKLSLAQDMTFEDLPPDLQGKVSAVREAANPKDTPASIASNLLAQYRSNRSGKNQSQSA